MTDPATGAADITIGPMRHDEVEQLAGWAADEGWNPGLADIGIAWDTDPEAFIAARDGDDLVGGLSIYAYGGRFGFMGLFIVRRDVRGRGIGDLLWRWRLDCLKTRFAPGATLGMDGVFSMVPYYEQGGFAFAYRSHRFQGPAAGIADPGVRPIAEADFAAIDRFDRAHVPAPRTAFLRRWMFRPGGHALALVENDEFVGYGVARPALTGFKLGPVFAGRPDVAERLCGSLMARFPGQQVQLDVPEPNTAGTKLAERFGLAPVFGCARMYCGPAPALPVDRIYGVTSFEFG